MALIERGRHPRFAIGESSTPLANLLLEELADRYELPEIRPFSKWGTWQRTRPDVAGGLKRGFTFYFHRPGEPFADDREHARQLLVAASPNDEIGDTHWYRPDFDHALVREAESAGTIYLDDTRLERITPRRAGITLEGTRRGRTVRIAARFVVDASGPRGFLHRALGTGEAPLRWLPPTQGLYTHFEECAALGGVGAARCGPAVPAGRCGAPPCVSRRMDLGAPVQQRDHERGRGADRSCRRARAAPPTARLAGIGCSRSCHPSRISSAVRGLCSRSSMRRASRSGHAPSAATTGRCCRRPQASSIRFSRPAFR